MSIEANILVISDLHLGEDLSPTATEACIRDLRLAEAHLIEFLRHYARRRVDGRPWRLVVNGDMVDFLTICVLPGDERLPPEARQAQHRDEYDHGLGRREWVAAVQIRAALDRHAELIAAMARFLAAGNQLDIIAGNHDTEMQWPAVQAAFRELIAAAWQQLPAARRSGAATAEQVAARIEFHPWFVYEPGVAWIEHGHQYDECCSFEFMLAAADESSGEIVGNVDAAGLRYVTNRIEDAEPHATEAWTFGGYLRFASSLGVRGAARLARGYYLFSRSLVTAWLASRSQHNKRAQRERHEERLEALSTRWSLPLSQLRAVDDLRRTPIVTNLRRLMQVLMLDKLAIYGVAAFLSFLALLTLPLAVAVVVALAVAFGSQLVSRHASRGRNIDPTVPLQLVPSRILSRIDARFVVFGHTHEPMAEALGEERVYFNTGTWLPSTKPGLLRAFTHVIIRHGETGPQAELCQWRDGASRAFTPGYAPAADDRTMTAARPLIGRPARAEPTLGCASVELPSSGVVAA